MVLMTDPPLSPLTPLSSPDEVKFAKTSNRRDAREIQSISEAENGAEERQKRNGRPGADLQLSLDAESDLSETRRKPTLMRSKTFDHAPLLQIPSDYETKIERKKSQSSQFSKTNTQYHKIFTEISQDEQLRQSYTCALQKDILYQGRLFVSDNWICFHSKVFGKDTKIAIPVLSVTLIKKTKTAILVPNALVVATANERHLFVSFLSRDTTYKFLKSVCFHLDGMSAGSSPIPSSAENSFRSDRPSSLPLDFSGDFSDLDGTVRQRRQDMESSSSGSQTPDYDKMAEFPIPQTFLNTVKHGEVPVHADVHLQQTQDATHGSQQNGLSTVVGVVHKMKSLQPVSLNTLLLVYLFLVCILVLSSCYMAFKIVALEQRLTSLGSMAEYPHNENVVHHRAQMEINAEIYGELSTNLLTLEKIQRNLQKLLEDAE
ncbi:GRAM domain-containing protein 2B isoform X2 [Megalops cyprinoides]|uniref:GRAM domain-containing protein 2B isoform X2 n=1 Tax=Megalops cyprinoides TaxID=118141 RepID=UPI001863FB12|nr:GRAM domain-containing protein 2B isoform X2 [Megalops cyprinoides]